MHSMFSVTASFLILKAFRSAINQKYLATSEAYLETEAGFILFKNFS